MLGRDVPYCIDRATPEEPARRGEPVVYFMHGTNGTAQTWTWNNYEASLAKMRAAGKLLPMTFVSFNTSPYSFFADAPVKPGTHDTSHAFESWFLREFMPYIEANLGVCAERACRGILGESMGGFGAIKTALRHPELFSTIAVNSPALSPFPDTERKPFGKWLEYFAFKPIGPVKALLLVEIVFHLFPTPDIFDENNPSWLVDHYDSQYPFPAIYFDMGGKDRYGFYDGYWLLKAALEKKGYAFRTLFEKNTNHSMWKHHAVDALTFMQEHVAQR
jgi:hypothetical protein